MQAGARWLHVQSNLALTPMLYMLEKLLLVPVHST